MIDRWLDMPEWLMILVLALGYTGTGAMAVTLGFLPVLRPTVISFQGIRPVAKVHTCDSPDA